MTEPAAQGMTNAVVEVFDRTTASGWVKGPIGAPRSRLSVHADDRHPYRVIGRRP